MKRPPSSSKADCSTNGESAAVTLRGVVEALDVAAAAPFLILAWTDGKKIDGGTYPIDEDMQGELRGIAASAVARMGELEPVEYRPLTDAVVGEDVLFVAAQQLRSDAPLLDFLQKPDGLRILKAIEIEQHSLALSIIAFGSKPEDRTFFVRRNAELLHGRGIVYARLSRDLSPVKGPLVSIDRSMDFILRAEGAVVFRADAFERFIQQPAHIAAEFSKDVGQLHQRLPFEPATLAALEKRGSRRLTIRVRLRSLLASTHFANLSVRSVTSELKRLSIAPDDYVKDGRMCFSAERAAFLLKVLDNAAWRGGFDNNLYSASGRRKESS